MTPGASDRWLQLQTAAAGMALGNISDFAGEGLGTGEILVRTFVATQCVGEMYTHVAQCSCQKPEHSR